MLNSKTYTVTFDFDVESNRKIFISSGDVPVEDDYDADYVLRDSVLSEAKILNFIVNAIPLFCDCEPGSKESLTHTIEEFEDLYGLDFTNIEDTVYEFTDPTAYLNETPRSFTQPTDFLFEAIGESEKEEIEEVDENDENSQNAENLQKTENDEKAQKKPESAVEHFQAILDSTLSLSLRAREAHWNIRGAFFGQLHELFNDFYDFLDESSDTLAERIVQLDGTVTTSPKSTQATLSGAKSYLQHLTDESKEIKDTVNSIIVNEVTEDPASQDILIEYVRELEKWIWKIESHLK